jgi:hypothetical protein
VHSQLHRALQAPLLLLLLLLVACQAQQHWRSCWVRVWHHQRLQLH